MEKTLVQRLDVRIHVVPQVVFNVTGRAAHVDPGDVPAGAVAHLEPDDHQRVQEQLPCRDVFPQVIDRPSEDVRGQHEEPGSDGQREQAGRHPEAITHQVRPEPREKDHVSGC